MGCFPEWCDARVRLEVALTAPRPYLTTFINMCWVIGQFSPAAVNKGSVGRTDEWGDAEFPEQGRELNAATCYGAAHAKPVFYRCCRWCQFRSWPLSGVLLLSTSALRHASSVP